MFNMSNLLKSNLDHIHAYNYIIDINEGVVVEETSFTDRQGNVSLVSWKWRKFRIFRNKVMNFHLYGFVLVCSALPDVIQKEITPDHEFIVLACDGEYLRDAVFPSR